jgi:hypothetical protein
MRRNFLSSALFATFVVLPLAAPAHAQATRSWVSGVGDDANPCSRTAPCKTFAGAISKTAAGGEIDALDPGGYGAVTITKGITIDGGGGQVASVLVAGTNGIVVSAGPNDIVTLRNLRITGVSGSGINGIRFLAGKALQVENCFIFGFSTHGIDVAPTTVSSVFVSNTTVSNAAGNGINILPSGAANLRVEVNRTELKQNGTGLKGDASALNATGFLGIEFRQSEAIGNTTSGIVARTTTGHPSIVMLSEQSTISNNGSSAGSVVADGPAALVLLSRSNVFFSPLGLSTINGGQIQSAGDNNVVGNATDGAPTGPFQRK